MIKIEQSALQIESLRERLAETEIMLSKATRLADDAYASLSSGDIETSQLVLGQLINSISEHFYEEIH